jgi:hypothetical protein
MSWLFHDTLFAVVVRAVLGPTHFPHIDEMSPPNVYQKTIRRVKSSETAIGRGTKDDDDPRGRSFAAFSELEAQTARSVALQSSLTLGRGAEDHHNLPNARRRSIEAFDEQGAHATQSVALQSSLTLGPLAEDQDELPNVRRHGFGAFDNLEAPATQPVALKSSVTILAPAEQQKSLKEEGADSLLVTWSGPDDPEVSQDHLSLGWCSVIDYFSKNPVNWSHGKKIWVMSHVSLLTFSVYIGSAIYTAGIEDIMQEYRVGLVAATLGLTLFVAGYGLGALYIDV